jgi:hypothetical protein
MRSFAVIIAVCKGVCAQPTFDHKAKSLTSYLDCLTAFLHKINCILKREYRTIYSANSFCDLTSSCNQGFFTCCRPSDLGWPSIATILTYSELHWRDESNVPLRSPPALHPATRPQPTVTHSAAVWLLMDLLKMDSASMHLIETIYVWHAWFLWGLVATIFRLSLVDMLLLQLVGQSFNTITSFLY